METQDAVRAIARYEGARLRPLRDDERDAHVSDTKEPLLVHLRRDTNGSVCSTGSGHLGHDNEPRMQFLCDFLDRRVLPLLDPATSIGGGVALPIELHDSFSYLSDADHPRYKNCMVFSRPRDSCCGALIPDPFHMASFGGLLDAARTDPVPWRSKESRLFFAGSTTGDRNPSRNERVRACVWALRQPPGSCDFRITNIAQMTREHLLESVPAVAHSIRPCVPVHDHFRYRYQVNIQGNTACWSRVPMIMSTQSLLVNLRHEDVMWYYPMMAPGTHFVQARGLDDMLGLRRWFDENAEEAVRITRNANAFARDVLASTDTAAIYLANFIEESIGRAAP